MKNYIDPLLPGVLNSDLTGVPMGKKDRSAQARGKLAARKMYMETNQPQITPEQPSQQEWNMPGTKDKA